MIPSSSCTCRGRWAYSFTWPSYCLIHLLVRRSHSLICGRKHKCRQGGFSRYAGESWPGRGEVLSKDLFRLGKPESKSWALESSRSTRAVLSVQSRLGFRWATQQLCHTACTSPGPQLRCPCYWLAQSPFPRRALGQQLQQPEEVRATPTVPAMSDAIRFCSSWRICTEVTAESWNRWVVFQPLPWFRQRRSMAKISPERQPLNSKGDCGKGTAWYPPARWGGAAEHSVCLTSPTPDPGLKVCGEMGWSGFGPQWS